MRDWRGIKAAIGDRVFYVSVTPPVSLWGGPVRPWGIKAVQDDPRHVLAW
jgi:hypothetical protein